MRKILRTLLSLGAAVCMTGCDSFLEVDRLGQNDIPKFFSDLDGLRTAVPGMYRLLYNFYDGSYMKYSDVAADMVQIGATTTDMVEQYEYRSLPEQSTGAVSSIWLDGYEVLVNTNNIIYYAPDLKSEYRGHEKEIDVIMAEALFVRALMHLYLCNCYAQPYNYTPDASHLGICVVTKLPDASDVVPREKVSVVYKRITDDLTEAIRLFDGKDPVDQPYRASTLACKALLARVYSYMERWQDARDLASEVIAARQLTPQEDYVNMIYDFGNSTEPIFRLNGKSISRHNLRSFYYYSDKDFGVMSSKFMNILSQTSSEDARRSLYNQTKSLKYYHPTVADPALEEKDRDYAPLVIRVSEMYLIRAEAYWNLDDPGSAVADLKSILGRAQGIDPAQVDLDYSGMEQLKAIIERERILELALEGHRLFDILRWKQDMVRDDYSGLAVSEVTYPNDKFILPIPQGEIDANPIPQNPGY